MNDSDPDYAEDLKKEKKRRKTKLYGRFFTIVVMIGFIIVVTFYEDRFNFLMFYYIASIAYIAFTGYRVLKEYSVYRSLTDDMLIEDGEIVKYNENMNKEIVRIPFENVEKVYYNIDELPRTLYVVHSRDGKTMAENFYKPRIKDKDEFYKWVKENGVMDKEPISFDDLKEEIVGSK